MYRNAMFSVQILGPLEIRINKSLLFLSISIYFWFVEFIPKIKIILCGSVTLNSPDIQKEDSNV
jgi:hypothetical protein